MFISGCEEVRLFKRDEEIDIIVLRKINGKHYVLDQPDLDDVPEWREVEENEILSPIVTLEGVKVICWNQK